MIIQLMIVLFGISDLAVCNLFENAEKEMEQLKSYLHTLSRQTMLQQFFSEQRIRSEGQSGIHIKRQRRGGTKNYFSETHSGYSTAAIHDHANNIRTVGMGEFTAVMNGIEFTTRHNDYRLFMPHTNSSEYHKTEPLPFPDVPEEVLNKSSIQEEIEEMREWFKAWRDQDYTVRDYRKYFKPILCYLEGAWTKTTKRVDEPFSSDRHFIDANTWMELHNKIMFTAYSGSKSIRENLSYLPTKIIEIINGTIPVFAQWNYRILCHPLQRDIPFKRLRVIEDLSSRMMADRDIFRHQHSRAARFQFNSKDIDQFFDRPLSNELLDELMEQIPGKDNYIGHLYDEGVEAEILNLNASKKDVSRYHRWYKIKKRDAMGTSNIHRGFNDPMLFAARTTQPKIAGMTLRKCLNRRNPKTCTNIHQKWSYAVPLEIIYLTPLSRWNPYKLSYHDGVQWKTPVAKNGRNGRCSEGKEFNGTNSRNYFITPTEFYTGGHIDRKTADTSRGVVCVLNKTGNSVKTRAAGTHVFLPYIKGVGIMRQRYPIFPVHGEGSSFWKELNALRDIVMDMKKWNYMTWSYDSMGLKMKQNESELSMGSSRSRKTTQHSHTAVLSKPEFALLLGGQDVYTTTSLNNGHQHELRIRYNHKTKTIFYVQCDNKWSNCWDNHARPLTVVTTDDEATA